MSASPVTVLARADGVASADTRSVPTPRIGATTGISVLLSSPGPFRLSIRSACGSRAASTSGSPPSQPSAEIELPMSPRLNDRARAWASPPVVSARACPLVTASSRPPVVGAIESTVAPASPRPSSTTVWSCAGARREAGPTRSATTIAIVAPAASPVRPNPNRCPLCRTFPLVLFLNVR
jgi:hypothetical protein